MSKQGHTPGPWHRNIPPATKYTTVWSGRNKHVAYVATAGLSPEEIEANIALIAAAPALLKAAQRALRALKAQGESVRPGNALGALEAAVRQATPEGEV